MLKITVVKQGVRQRLIVEGKLAEPCVSELEGAWDQARQEGGGCPICVDLSDVALIDPRGEAVLAAMIAEGARLTARGVYSEYIARRLMKRAQKHRARVYKHEGTCESDSTRESRSVTQCSPDKER